MNCYEMLYIIENSLDEAAKEAVIAKYSQLVTDNGGSVEKVDKWGSKRLAYPINDKNDGFYVLLNFTSVSTLPLEMDRVMKIDEQIMRQMIVKK